MAGGNSDRRESQREGRRGEVGRNYCEERVKTLLSFGLTRLNSTLLGSEDHQKLRRATRPDGKGNLTLSCALKCVYSGRERERGMAACGWDTLGVA